MDISIVTIQVLDKSNLLGCMENWPMADMDVHASFIVLKGNFLSMGNSVRPTLLLHS